MYLYMFQLRRKFINKTELIKLRNIITGENKPLNDGVEQEMKAWFLYFDHNNICRLVKKKVKDGQADIEDKRFHIDLSKPLLWKRKYFFGLMETPYEPLFIIKWDEIYPDKTVNPIDPAYLTNEKVNPEMLKKTMSLKIIGNMLKTPKEVNWLMVALIGIAFGAFVMYYAVEMKMIKL
jgi:hypothetical protein